jgi:NADPH:quinone reductase-like Zn-dependent oxidoreductase
MRLEWGMRSRFYRTATPLPVRAAGRDVTIAAPRGGAQWRHKLVKSWWILIEDGRRSFEMRDVPAPVCGDDEVLVRVKAAALNRGELIIGAGLHKAGVARPAGAEAAGVVERAGAAVSHLKAGDRVMGRAAGGFAEFTRMHAAEAMPVPAGLDWRQAAAIPLVFNVSYDMLVAQGRIKAGEWLLITAASSGVGVASLQLGKALGARVIGTSGSDGKLARLRELGLDAGIMTRGPNFAAKVKEITGGHGADVIVNNVGGSVFAECMRASAFEGRMATVGYLDRTLTAQIDIALLHEQRLTLFGVSNKLRNASQRAVTVQAVIRDVLPLVAEGRIRPCIDRVFPFAELPQAVAYMESDAQIGKVLIELQ